MQGSFEPIVQSVGVTSVELITPAAPPIAGPSTAAQAEPAARTTQPRKGATSKTARHAPYPASQKTGKLNEYLS
jgi:hypothetical protein